MAVRTVAARSVAVVAAIAINVAMQVSGFLAAPTYLRPDPTWVTVHLIVAVVFALCAAAIWSTRGARAGIAASLMVVFPVAWIPQTFLNVVSAYGAIWPIVAGVELSWTIVLMLIVLSYPFGVFSGRFERFVAVAMLILSAAFFVATLLLRQPEADDCICVPNAYAITDDPVPWAIADLIYRGIGIPLVIVVSARLLLHWWRGSVPARAVAFIMPAALLSWTIMLVVIQAFRLAGTSADIVVDTFALFTVASIPIAYVAGVIHARNMRVRVADLMRITREGADRAEWAGALTRVLGDESMRVYWWDESSGRYADASGEAPGTTAAGEGTLAITSREGAPIAVIFHDKVLTQNTRLLDGISSALRLTIDNSRLRAEVERTLEHVRQSRQRIVESTVTARKDLERDLHDGAQQRLVNLAITLRLVAERPDVVADPQLSADVDDAIEQVGGALAELRQLAHGIHPTLLSQGGLSMALPELAGRCPVPVEVVADVGRLPEIIEVTAYFVASEALANIAKHAHATRAWLRVAHDDGQVAVTIRDNGAGGADAAGSGMTGMADRVEAAGGTLEVESPPGAGTTITARLPS